MSDAPRRRGYGPERLTDCGDDYVRVDLLDAAEKRIADLEALLRERDGGIHDNDCKIWRYIQTPPFHCTCGHDAVVAALKGKSDG